MSGKPCAKCGKSIGWISQNKIEGVIYCEDCWKELKQGKKETGNELTQEKKEADNELIQGKKETGNELMQEKKEADNELIQGKKETGNELTQGKKEAGNELIQEKKEAIIDSMKKKFRKKEEIILLTTAAILTLILLFPPFLAVYKGIEINSGYFFILSPPVPHITDSEISIASNINIPLLFVQYLFTITIGGILWFVFKKK